MSKIILKKSSVVDKVPLASDLDYGELALNYADSKLFFKKSDNTVGVIGGGAGSALQNRYSYTATAAQTTFSASYTPPYVDVYLNGLRLSSGVDYTATNGSTVVLTEAAAVNDLVEIVAQVASTTVLVDDTKLPLAGGTMTGAIVFDAAQTFPGTQSTLVSGTTIKTINGTSVLGSGNIQIDGGVVSFNTRTGAVTLSSTDVTTALGFTPVTQTAVDSSISALVDSAPGTLDTLNELAAALGDDPNFATTVSTSIAARLPLAGGTMTGAIGFAGAQTWPTFNQSTTGNAATATALQTARTIGGVSFNGTANINLPGVNTAGNQNTSGSSASCTGNSATATALSSGQSNWSGTGVLGNVVGLMSWKNYANGHVIFDASNSTSPSGGAVNNTNAAVAWSASYPTLMGWNGSSTYGVRVDSARVSDNTTGNAVTVGGLAVSGTTNNSPNQIVRTDGSGYANFGWINSISGDNGRGTIARVTASNDAYLRYYTPANFNSAMDRTVCLRESNGGTMAAGNIYTIYTGGGAVGMYLPTPANTAQGDTIRIVNLLNSWSAGNPFYVYMNGATLIMGLNETMTCNINVGGFTLICNYNDGTARWSVTS
jgi:hypothetical protein